MSEKEHIFWNRYHETMEKRANKKKQWDFGTIDYQPNHNSIPIAPKTPGKKQNYEIGKIYT